MKIAGLRKILYNTSLLKKLTLAYAVCILVPVLLVGVYTYQRYQRNMNDEVVKSAQQSLRQIKDGIMTKISLAENTGNHILYTNVITEFFGRKYVFSNYTMEQYNQYIIPYLTSAATLSYPTVHRMRIYAANSSIPEHGELVYRDNVLKDFAWYRSFMSQAASSLWLYNHQSDFMEEYGASGSRVFTLVKRLSTAAGRYIGVITLDVLQEEMFASVNRAAYNERTLYITEGAGNILFASQAVDSGLESTVLNEYAHGISGNFVYQGVLYNYESIEPLNIKLVSKETLVNLMKPFRDTVMNVLLASLAGLIILFILTYCILGLIWKRVRNIVKVMNNVADGNFHVRIPIEGNDEAGQLARDFNILIGKIDELIRDVLQKETTQRDAQLTALQYQINPHFIYNTFDIFRARLELDGNYEMADTIGKFGRMLRYNLHGNSKYASLQEEVMHIRNYIDLQRIRHGSCIDLQVGVTEQFTGMKILKFILQPVVENCIRHGIHRRDQSLCININFFREEGTLKIVVADNGAGINARRLEEINYKLRYQGSDDAMLSENSSIGLSNINHRIRMFYGRAYHISLESEPGIQTRTIITIPVDKNDGGVADE